MDGEASSSELQRRMEVWRCFFLTYPDLTLSTEGPPDSSGSIVKVSQYVFMFNQRVPPAPFVIT